MDTDGLWPSGMTETEAYHKAHVFLKEEQQEDQKIQLKASPYSSAVKQNHISQHSLKLELIGSIIGNKHRFWVGILQFQNIY